MRREDSMKSFKPVGTIKVRVDYSRGKCVETGRNGTIAVYSTIEDGIFSETFTADPEFVPTIDYTRDRILAFRDERQEGLSGKDCPGRVLVDESDHWVFEIEAKIMKEMWDCQCCSHSYDPYTGDKKSTGLGKNPEVTQFADDQGWGVVCNDCGTMICMPTKDEAIKSWNAHNAFNKAPDKVEGLNAKPASFWREIPF